MRATTRAPFPAIAAALLSLREREVFALIATGSTRVTG
jgi:DNA-binding CsgD family transcriptional regulator